MRSLSSAMLSFLSFFLYFISLSTSKALHTNFLHCFYSHTNLSSTNSDVLLTKNTYAYSYVLQFSAQNLRFLNSKTPKPEFIIQPLLVSQIQETVLCAKKTGIQIRVRSGGHDYEGLSYVSTDPFLILDLANFQSVKIDLKNQIAWVDSGATLGQLYHAIAQKSKVYGFPAGSCPSVGVGGHISGGGFGTIFRKYGLAADNVVDVKLVDVNGRILDRRSMGEDFFWAIRGGGGASFGVIFSWKVKLVIVPSNVTVCSVQKTLEQGATTVLFKWQTIADKLPDEIFLHATTYATDSSQEGKKTVGVSFSTLFLGEIEELLPTMNKRFPELGLDRGDCSEMGWIQSVLHFAGFSTRESYNVLTNRTRVQNIFFKAKSDFVREPISETGWEMIWKILIQDEAGMLILTPYGGKMDDISESAVPFPHRRGNLYKIQYTVAWELGNETERHVDWIRRLYSHMTRYVSKAPRAAYVNYRDLDPNSTMKRQPQIANNNFFQHHVTNRQALELEFAGWGLPVNSWSELLIDAGLELGVNWTLPTDTLELEGWTLADGAGCSWLWLVEEAGLAELDVAVGSCFGTRGY